MTISMSRRTATSRGCAGGSERGTRPHGSVRLIAATLRRARSIAAGMISSPASTALVNWSLTTMTLRPKRASSEPATAARYPAAQCTQTLPAGRRRGDRATRGAECGWQTGDGRRATRYRDARRRRPPRGRRRTASGRGIRPPGTNPWRDRPTGLAHPRRHWRRRRRSSRCRFAPAPAGRPRPP